MCALSESLKFSILALQKFLAVHVIGLVGCLVCRGDVKVKNGH